MRLAFALSVFALVAGCSGPEVQDGAPRAPRPHVLHVMSVNETDVYIEVTPGAGDFALIGRTTRERDREAHAGYACFLDYTLPAQLDGKHLGLLVSAVPNWCQQSSVFTGTDVTIVAPLYGVPQRPFPEPRSAPTSAPAPAAVPN